MYDEVGGVVEYIWTLEEEERNQLIRVTELIMRLSIELLMDEELWVFYLINVLKFWRWSGSESGNLGYGSGKMKFI